MHRRGRSQARLWFGLGFIALGVLWTLDNLYYIDSGRVLAWWPVLVVLFGVNKLFGRSGRSPFAALLWIALGLLLLLHTTEVVPWDVWQLWPLFLVFVGATIVWRSLQGPRAPRFGRHGEEHVADDAASAGASDADEISAVVVWAGVDRKTNSQAFRGGDLTAVMGGGNIDLRGARAVPGGAVIDLFVVMGGVEITVPPDWHIVNEIWVFMGGVEDSRKSTVPAGESVLYLKGICVMGGVEIRNPKN